MTLTFPTWKQIENLDKNKPHSFNIFWFDTIPVSGTLTLYEFEFDEQADDMIYFDVLINGNEAIAKSIHSEYSELGYKKICDYAQKIYDSLCKELIANINTEYNFGG